MANAAADEISVDTLDMAVLLLAVVAAAIIFATVALALRFIDDGVVELSATSGFAPDIFCIYENWKTACCINSTPIQNVFLLSWK